MKKTTIIITLLLTACTPLSKRESLDARDYAQSRPRSLLIDLCSPENMPRYQKRPRLRASELANMSEREMDVRIRQHIASLEKHIDSLEDTVAITRRRVALCQ